MPRTGGVILAKGSKAEVEALCASDPFAIHNLADYDFTEMDATMTAPGYEALKG